MAGERIGIIISSIGLGFSTVLSKLLGVLRDVLIAMVFGTSAAAGAWQIALVAPNMFRRIFGEGAVGTAMVPLLSDSLVKRGNRAYAAEQLRAILLAVGAVLLVIVMLGMTLPLLWAWLTFTPETSEDYWYMVIAVPYAMPYAFFICLSGVATSALNVTKNFFWPGITGLFFNLATISLLCAYWFLGLHWSTPFLLMMMCLSVTVSGVIQLFWLIVLLKRNGMLCRAYYHDLPWKETLTSLFKLSFPALIGASALQISMTVDWALAACLGGYAVASLSYAEHIAFLPISVVALSLGVVGLAHMTLAVSEGKMDEMKSLFNFGLRYVLFLTVPMTVFLCFFAEDIVRVILERGNFNEESVGHTVFALRYLALGIPFFCLSKITVSGFHCRKEMLTPVKVSVMSNVVNMVCAVTLMQLMGQGGIALAMVISSGIYNVVLMVLIQKQLGDFGFTKVMFTAIRSVLCAAFSLLPLYFMYALLPKIQLVGWLSDKIFPLFLAGIIFCVLYTILAFVVRAEEIRPILRRLSRYRNGGQS